MPTESQNVLLLAKGFPPDVGGIETYSFEVAKAYADAGHQVHVVTSHLEKPLQSTARFTWFRSIKQSGQARVALGMLLALMKLRLGGYRPDVIHATSWRVASVARLVWPKVCMAVTLHGKEVFTISRMMKAVARKTLSASDRIVFVSDAIRQIFNREFPGLEDRTVVAWNGITEFGKDAGQYQRDRNALFTVCRLVERKNIEAGIRALALLRDRGGAFSYRIAGTGPETENIKRAISECGLSDSVTMLGFTEEEDLPGEYCRAAVFLHPQIVAADGADIEGFGITIADAMQFGCVPVAGRNGGPLDFIADGETGYLVDGSDVEGLAQRLESLLGDGETQDRIGDAAKRFASDNLTWKSHAETVLSSLQDRSDR
ncbi:glycosyltransferase family 4 protein [Qipengyuania aquimaris]|uniref:glycosyltransferase family 4 protein n=1 Tax=Qipengyuania aquimaris TaxID=255984 RepID=UPI001FD40FC8|nr:glycosyltransferase family 4 protein [Qipengyuania aquimaris]UOR14986.1 glycosyltransferase family 4 protein [Qipengyuania aquimaris]